MQSVETRVNPAQEVVQRSGLNEIHSMGTEVVRNFGVERKGRLEGDSEREKWRVESEREREGGEERMRERKRE